MPASGHGIGKRDRRGSRTESKRTQKPFGEAFGAATVAGYAGPGFYNWPSGHIDQTPDRKRHRSICPNGATHTSPGCKPWEPHPIYNRCVLKEHRIGKGGVEVRGTRLCGVPSEREECCPGGSPGFAPWAAMRCPLQGMGFETRWTSPAPDPRSGNGTGNRVGARHRTHGGGIAPDTRPGIGSTRPLPFLWNAPFRWNVPPRWNAPFRWNAPTL